MNANDTHALAVGDLIALPTHAIRATSIRRRRPPMSEPPVRHGFSLIAAGSNRLERAKPRFESSQCGCSTLLHVFLIRMVKRCVFDLLIERSKMHPYM